MSAHGAKSSKNANSIGPTPATFGSALCSAHWGREIYILEPAQDGAAQAALLAEIPEGHASIGEC